MPALVGAEPGFLLKTRRRFSTRRYLSPFACRSSVRNASMMSSNRTSDPRSPTRNSGADSIAHASEAHEARIARFSFSVRSGDDNQNRISPHLTASLLKPYRYKC